MKKYRKAIRRVLHMFNYAKRVKDVRTALGASDSFWGIKLVAIADDEISIEDYEKMSNLYDAMMKYIDRM